MVDAAILVAAVRGRSSGAVIDAAAMLTLITSERAVEEARRRIELGMRRPDLLPILDAICAQIETVPAVDIVHLLPAAELGLRDARRRTVLSLEDDRAACRAPPAEGRRPERPPVSK